MSIAPGLPAEDVDRFRRALAAQVGLRVDDDGLPLLEQVLEARLHATRCAGVTDYLDHRLPLPGETAELARALSVAETFFMRNRDQFNALEAIIRAQAASGVRRLRVLSAACSSGEEPYSIAMLLRETLPDLAQWDISITAFDINPDCIERARAARYRAWSLRETPADLLHRYFAARGDEFLLDDAVRRMVRLEQRNFMDPDASFWRSEQYEIVFCRNMLMYFTPEAVREAVARISRALAPGGYLFLGHAENLRGNAAGFHLCHTHGTFYYQKRAGSQAHTGFDDVAAAPTPVISEPLPADVSWFEAIADASSRIRSLAEQPQEAAGDARAAPAGDGLSRAMELWQHERFGEALEALPASKPDPDALLLRAMLLVSRADSRQALQVCEQLLAADELNAAAHYVKALCQEHLGRPREAIEHDQIAAYLDPQFAMPHLHLGLLARRSGDRQTARRELAAASSLFEREGTSRIVLFGGGFGREQLIALCKAELKAVEGAP